MELFPRRLPGRVPLPPSASRDNRLITTNYARLSILIIRDASRYRDTAMVIGIVAVTMILVAILVIWLVQRFNISRISRRIWKLHCRISWAVIMKKRCPSWKVRQQDLKLKSTQLRMIRLIKGILKQIESDGTVKINPQSTILNLYVSIGQGSLEVPDVAGNRAWRQKK